MSVYRYGGFYLIRKRLFIIVIIITTVIIARFGHFYYSYASDLIFKESSTHLTEIYSQVSRSLSSLLNENWGAMDMWIPYLSDTNDDNKIRKYLENIRSTSAFTDFYFLSEDGSYCTINGNKGYMDLGKSMKKLMDEGENVISDTALVDRSELVVFAVPCPKGTYMNFSYSAIAISFNNDDIVSLLSAKTFNGSAENYVIYSDGRVVVNDKGEHGDEINNFWDMLAERSDSLNDENIQQYRSEICYNESGVDKLVINGESHYIAYESIGFKDWILIGIMPTDIVNSNINDIQSVTISASVSIVILISSLTILYLLRKNYLSIKQKNTEIRYREELFSVLSNNVDDIFIMMDHDNFKIRYISPNVERILGISQQNAIKDVSKIVNASRTVNKDAMRMQFNSLCENEKKEWDSEYIHQKNRELRWFHVTALRSRINGDDKYILVLSDRTKERNINLALHNAVDEAKRANQAKSLFLSTISHDIRTPLNAIIGFAQLVQNDKNTSDLTKDYINKISTAGRQLLGLISDILDIGVIESGKLTFNLSDINLSQILYEIRTVIITPASAKSIKLTFDMNNVKHETVRCDRHRLEQLLINLLTNAIKFTPDNGEVSLTLTEKTCEKKGFSDFEIIVADNGMGMSEEFVRKIFKPFEREGKDRYTEGTGLGMAIAKSIVDAAGGKINIDTKQGEGTIITVELRLEICDFAEEKYCGISALVIDSDDKQRANTASILEHIDITVNSSAYFTEDLLYSSPENNPYDILITDIGFVKEASQCFKNSTDADIIYIVTTANTENTELSKYPNYVKGVCLTPLLTYDIRLILSEYRKKISDSATDSNYENKDISDKAMRILDGKHILLAEDVAVNVRIVKAMLAKYNVNIEVADDGRKAFEMFSSNHNHYYDVILMDLQMPIMDGYESTKEIRNTDSDYARTIPIIAMTANAFSDDMAKAKQCGMNDYLIKPVGIDELTDVLMRAVSEMND